MIYKTERCKTLRLLIPEWQSGDYDSQPSGEIYPLGARLLAFLAPQNNTSPIVEVSIEPYHQQQRTRENGVVWQDVIIHQLKATQKIIDEHEPDRIITFGGTCIVSQAPFAYLNRHYNGKIGLLWIDSHPDISTPKHFDREHAMVLGNLLGKGDPYLANEVRLPFKANQVLIIGIHNYNNAYEKKIVHDLGLQTIASPDLTPDNQAIFAWIRKNNFEHLAIHVDVDVLNPRSFYSQFSNNPISSQTFNNVKGEMTIPQLSKIIQDVSLVTNIVGITFAEHMPWDALNLKKMMEQFSFMK